MVIDHINLLWFDHAVLPMFLIGRGTFPLFCYAVAVAVMKAGPAGPRRYAGRLLLAAVVAQPFYYFSVGGGMANVIFTLAAGSLLAGLSGRLRPWQMYAIYSIALASMMWKLPLEFGLAGVALPSALLLALRGQKSVYPFLLLLLFFVNMGGFLEALIQGPVLSFAATFIIVGLAAAFLPLMVLDAARYMKQAGRLLPKYALHVFYPGHLVLLKITGLFFFPK